MDARYNTNDLSGALRSALDDSNISYTLGFYLDSESLDGKPHELKVQVSRPGLTVRYRREYLASIESPAPAEERQNNILNALESPLESAHIPLSARVAPGEGSLKISWSIDVHTLQLQHRGNASTGAINVFFVQKDGTGKVLDTAQQAYEIHVKNEDYETFLRTEMSDEKAIVLKNGAKTLRIVVADRTSAAVGSLIISLSKVK